MKDSEIIAALCSSGADQSRALLELYRDKGAEFKRRFRKEGIPAQDCDDVIQEVVISIVRYAKDFRDDGLSDNGAHWWMWKIAKNKMFDYLRRNAGNTRHASGALNDEDWVTEHRKELEQGELRLIQDEAIRLRQLEIDLCVSLGLEDFCAEYPDRSRVLMMQMDGESIDSISHRIGKTVGATKEYLSQCRKKLRPYVQHCHELLSA